MQSILRYCAQNKLHLGFEVLFPFKGSVNPELVKNIARCNFLIITVMYMKVYIFGMEVSQRIRFWYQIWPKMLIFWENGKKLFFLVKKFCDKLRKIILS